MVEVANEEVVFNQNFVKDVKIEFGKYKDKMLSNIFENDKNYCVWLMNNKQLISKYPLVKMFLKERLLDKNSYYMQWGKFKGRSLDEIDRIEPKYIRWLCDNKYVIESCPKLNESLDKYR
jgi:uncharacterized protein (DUF3820 family)